ncbi:hypothetical protein WAI453_007883 [Rhynchosporium graminicola]|uniref:chitin deacetylase n=1 Tax=Rhynchosporium graminicola TaxID=2792576 RepID=A0A1E1KUW8_9HELO|nr:related to nodulation protein nodB [Rhynchosporium commune]
MRLSGLIRRTRRLGVFNIWSSIYSKLNTNHRRKHKHIKIDDEESQFNKEPLHTFKAHGYRTMYLLILIPLLIILTLLILAYIIYRPPHLLIRYLQHHNPSVVFHVPLPASQRIVALTLDDAPSSETPHILDLLKAHNATATFFIIGSQALQHPKIIQRIHAEGHELGNHAMTDSPSFRLPLSELSHQIAEVDALLPGNSNSMKYFRPGSGWFNAGMRERVERAGYRLVLGGVYPHDPQIARPRLNAWHVLSLVRPGSVVVMHDRRAYSVEQARRVLEGLERRGYRAVSVGGLLAVAEVEARKKGG